LSWNSSMIFVFQLDPVMRAPLIVVDPVLRQRPGGAEASAQASRRTSTPTDASQVTCSSSWKAAPPSCSSAAWHRAPPTPSSPPGAASASRMAPYVWRHRCHRPRQVGATLRLDVGHPMRRRAPYTEHGRGPARERAGLAAKTGPTSTPKSAAEDAPIAPPARPRRRSALRGA